MKITISQLGGYAFKVTVEESKQSYMETSLKAAIKLASKLKEQGEKKTK
jgi:hypothetical protein